MFEALTSFCKLIVRLVAVAILLGFGLPMIFVASAAFGAIFASIALFFGACVGIAIIVLASWWIGIRGSLVDFSQIVVKAVKEAKK